MPPPGADFFLNATLIDFCGELKRTEGGTARGDAPDSTRSRSNLLSAFPARVYKRIFEARAALLSITQLLSRDVGNQMFFCLFFFGKDKCTMKADRPGMKL